MSFYESRREVQLLYVCAQSGSAGRVEGAIQVATDEDRGCAEGQSLLVYQWTKGGVQRRRMHRG